MEALASIPKAGAYQLLSGSTPTGSGRSMTVNRELATLVAAPAAPDGPEVREEEAERLLGGEYRICRHPGVDFPGPSAAADLRTAKSVTPRLIRFTQKPWEEVYMINDKTYDHRRIDTRVRLGSVEEWTIRNETQDMHVFHIHQVHFQVVSINGQAQPFDRLLDTVRVPEMGEVVVRIAFTDPRIVGRFVYHCHVLKHEDKGMMANIEVYDPHPGARRLAPEVESHAGHGA
jgi:FtsP/CotA-like multicopper oxidase with cupredoxin domain